MSAARCILPGMSDAVQTIYSSRGGTVTVSEPYYNVGGTKVPARTLHATYGGEGAARIRSTAAAQQTPEQRAQQLYTHLKSQGYQEQYAQQYASAAFYEMTGGHGTSPYAPPVVSAPDAGQPVTEVLSPQQIATIRQTTTEQMLRKVPSLDAARISGEVGLYEQQVETYNRAIEAFNEKYGGRQLSTAEYKEAYERQQQLETARAGITAKQEFLQFSVEGFNKRQDILQKQAEAASPQYKAEQLITQTAGKPEGLALMYAVTTLTPQGFLGLRPGLALAQGKPEQAKEYLSEGVQHLFTTYGEPGKPASVRDIVFGAATSPLAVGGIGAAVGGAAVGYGMGVASALAPGAAAVGTKALIVGSGLLIGARTAEPWVNPDIVPERKLTESAARVGEIVAIAPIAMSMYPLYHAKGMAEAHLKYTVPRAVIKEWGISDAESTRSVVRVESGYKLGWRRANIELPGSGWVGKTDVQILGIKYPNYLATSKTETAGALEAYRLDAMGAQAAVTKQGGMPPGRTLHNVLEGLGLKIAGHKTIHHIAIKAHGFISGVRAPYSPKTTVDVGEFAGVGTKMQYGDAVFYRVQQWGTYYTGKGEAISAARDATFLTTPKSTLLGGGLSYAQKMAITAPSPQLTAYITPPTAPVPVYNQDGLGSYALAVTAAPGLYDVHPPAYAQLEAEKVHPPAVLYKVHPPAYLEAEKLHPPAVLYKVHPPAYLTQELVHPPAVLYKVHPPATAQAQQYATQQLQVTQTQQLQVMQTQQLQLTAPPLSLTLKPPVPLPFIFPVGLPKLGDFPAARPGGKTSRQAFSVLVRERGSWRLKAEALPLGKALRKGAAITLGTPARSFKLIDAGLTEMEDSPRPSLHQFYRKGSALIERRKYAIDTPGELRGITYKGLAAARYKKPKRVRGWL